MPIKKVGKFGLDEMTADFLKAKTKMPLILGNLTKRHFVKGFQTSGGQTDASRSGWKKAMNKQGRKTLIGKRGGTLKRDIKVRSKTFGRIAVGTSSLTKNYAETHNKGADIKVTEKMRKYFWAKYSETGDEFYKNMALHKSDTITIPKREYIGKSRILEAMIKARLYTEINKMYPPKALK